MVQTIKKLTFCIALIVLNAFSNSVLAQPNTPVFEYIISIPNSANHSYHVSLHTSHWEKDTVNFKIPVWMPGYYQLMDYAKSIKNLSAKDQQGNPIQADQLNKTTWQLTGIKDKHFVIQYEILTSRKFVANSYVDKEHAYIVPGNSFLYVKDYLHVPVTVKIENNGIWNEAVSGLKSVKNKTNVFKAENFNILYDSPILIGELESLPSFYINGIEHRFIGYYMGEFNHEMFINKLKKAVQSAVEIIGHIPFNQYTFIGIGPGRGGIEHLNNTTVSFSGNNLNNAKELNRMLNFLTHEYFHHYNAKRIRPVELGPFNYSKQNRTNLLWVSEGLTKYYEYIIMQRANLSTLETLFSHFENHINKHANNPGRFNQSLIQSSYYTWEDGPFGKPGETISYYQKGPIIGLLLDFSIRHASQNKHSLDHVMRYLYQNYYQKKKRGFTDAEFQQACEQMAGTSLSDVFEYVYTTKEIDYAPYLAFAGLRLNLESEDGSEKRYTLSRMENRTELQNEIFNSWLDGK